MRETGRGRSGFKIEWNRFRPGPAWRSGRTGNQRFEALPVFPQPGENIGFASILRFPGFKNKIKVS
jgi:hypothetical protein